MDNFIIVKYDYTGEPVKEKQKVVVLFNYDKCIQVMHLGCGNNREFLKKLNNQVITMEFEGESYDRMGVFIIDKQRVMRKLKLNNILD